MFCFVGSVASELSERNGHAQPHQLIIPPQLVDQLGADENLAPPMDGAQAPPVNSAPKPADDVPTDFSLENPAAKPTIAVQQKSEVAGWWCEYVFSSGVTETVI